MYGRVFESMYRGSMVGMGSAFFAVWGYVIAMMRPDKEVGAQVELNPKLLAFILGEKEAVVEGVIEKMCQPDPASRSSEEEGRRLVKVGQFDYRVVNGAKYMEIRNEEERREAARERKSKSRLKSGKPLAGEMLYEKTGQMPHEFREVAKPYAEQRPSPGFGPSLGPGTMDGNCERDSQ